MTGNPQQANRARRQTNFTKVVGNSFVGQYYDMLSADTQNLYRFYKDESTFTHGEGAHPEPAASGMANIKQKISSLGLADAQVTRNSVDAQRSKDGGVLVMVTGTMIVNRTKPKARMFVQTFFLAPQHQKSEQVSYFVLNDTFRFMDAPADAATETSAGVHSYDTNGDVSHADDSALSSGADGKGWDDKQEAAGSSEASDGGMVNVVMTHGPEGADDTDASEPKGGAGTLSWASLVKKGPSSVAPTATVPSGQARVAGKTGEQELPSADGAGGWGDEDDEGEEEDDDMAGLNGSGGFDPSMKDDQPCTSLYVKNFAATTSEEQLKELFLKFGTIKNISVKLDRGFAFVDFHDPDAVAQVLAATPETFLVDGKRLVVEERQSRDSRTATFRGTPGRGGGRVVGRGGRAGGRGGRGTGGGRAPKTA